MSNEVHAEFQNGGFTINKTGNPFSEMAIDQAHEQNNAMVKGDGGAVGLTENFFQHENQPCPPSLSHVGKLRLSGNKSDLIDALSSVTGRGTKQY